MCRLGVPLAGVAEPIDGRWADGVWAVAAETGVTVLAGMPPYPNRTHVESRVAYKLQEEAFGGLAPETKHRLEAIGAKHSKIVFAPSRVISISRPARSFCANGAIGSTGDSDSRRAL